MSSRRIPGSIDRLYNKLLKEIGTSKKLSELLPSVIIFSKQIGDKSLEKWSTLEFSGYFNTNKELTNDIIVPEYRTVPGYYRNKYGQKLNVRGTKLNFVNEQRLRNGVAELERLSESTIGLEIQDNEFNQLVLEHFNFDAIAFKFDPRSIIGILSEIRTTLLNKLTDIALTFEKTENMAIENTSLLVLNGLHPKVLSTSSRLYKNGHYRQAILDTYIMLVNEVQKKSEKNSEDGTKLMQKVFSQNKPIIKISDNSDEQLGFMWLFTGAVMAIRNPKAHSLLSQDNPQRALEWLSFASVLLRVLDEATIVEKE